VSASSSLEAASLAPSCQVSRTGVDAAAVRQAGIDHRAGLVDATAHANGNPLDHLDEVLLAESRDRGGRLLNAV
jgi:hypothetical protein